MKCSFLQSITTSAMVWKYIYVFQSWRTRTHWLFGLVSWLVWLLWFFEGFFCGGFLCVCLSGGFLFGFSFDKGSKLKELIKTVSKRWYFKKKKKSSKNFRVAKYSITTA